MGLTSRRSCDGRATAKASLIEPLAEAEIPDTTAAWRSSRVELLPDHRSNVPRALRGVGLRGAQQRFVLAPPLSRHVRAEVGGRHHRSTRAIGGAVTHGHDVAEETGRTPRVHHIRHAALEVWV